jgi:DNA-binding NarL/FixJ family response regulator
MDIPMISRQDPILNVLIVDDHPILRVGLRNLLQLESDIKVVAEAGTGEQALEIVRRTPLDVVVLDINLPSMNGLQVTSRLKADYPRVAVVLVTGYDDSEQRLHAMRVGASAYLPKDTEADVLVNVVRQAARGNYVINGKIHTERTMREWLQQQMDARGTYIAADGEPFLPLSPREMEILRCVTRGLSNKEIATELSISEQTVKNHMTSILGKLKVQDRTQAAVYALTRGWVRPSDQHQNSD